MEKRKCLRCDGEFKSEWIGNRVCYECRKVNARFTDVEDVNATRSDKR